MIAFPNAKINIGLFIKEKREDGYHNLESIFYPIGLSDVLEVIPSSTKTNVEVVGKNLGNPEDNICFKAWQILHREFNIPPVKITLLKNIPVGAGLGGGSADGAQTLILLNNLFQLNLSNSKLMVYALQLGSDCPFFINNKVAYVTGRGENMTPLNLDLKGYSVFLVYPNLFISTKEAYGLVKPNIKNHSLHSQIQMPPENWKGSVENDFEQALFKKYPVLNEIKKTLYDSGAVFASMSGSGSSMFGIFKNIPENLFPTYFTWSGKLN